MNNKQRKSSQRTTQKKNNDRLTVALGAFATFEIDIEDYFPVTGKERARRTRRTRRYLWHSWKAFSYPCKRSLQRINEGSLAKVARFLSRRRGYFARPVGPEIAHSRYPKWSHGRPDPASLSCNGDSSRNLDRNRSLIRLVNSARFWSFAAGLWPPSRRLNILYVFFTLFEESRRTRPLNLCMVFLVRNW